MLKISMKLKFLEIKLNGEENNEDGDNPGLTVGNIIEEIEDGMNMDEDEDVHGSIEAAFNKENVMNVIKK